MKYRLLILIAFLSIAFKGYGQNCTLAVTLSASSTTICTGYSVTLTAEASGGTAPYTYIWSTGETTTSINVNKAGTYKVTVSDNTPGCQPVMKDITVTSSLTPDAPTVKGVNICPNTSTTLTATAPGGTYQWYATATGDDSFLSSGSSYTTPILTSNTTYYVQTTVDGCTSERTAVTVGIIGNPNVAGATVCYGSVATLQASGGSTYEWYAGKTSTKILSTAPSYTTDPLTATTTYYVVASTGACTSTRVPVTATVLQPPTPPTSSGVTICSGSAANLHADVPSGTIDWFNVPTGGTSLITSPDYTTPALTTTTTYYAQVTNSTGCISDRTPVTVVVNSPPATPPAQAYNACYNSSVTLTASNPKSSYNWYSAASGGTLLTTGYTYNTPVLTANTTYYLQEVNGSCVSGLAPITVTVTPMIPAPQALGAVICPGSVATLTVTSPGGGTYNWYDAATAGNILATNTASYTTLPLSTTTTYYVDETIAGCTSARTAVTVTVLPAPSAPTASNQNVCYNNPAVLTATGSSNGYAWYDAATNGNLLSQDQVYVTTALTANTTYYVQATDASGCVSARTPVTVTVNPIPSAPTANGQSICAGTAASLSASAAAGATIQWFTQATGGTQIATGSPFNTPNLSSNTTYYVQSVVAGCTSSRTAVTVTINAQYTPQFQYSSGTYCQSAGNTIPVINNPAGSTFSAAPAGLFFVSTTTGEINVGASTPGDYTVSFSNNGPCPGTSSVQISIVNSTNATFTYNGPYCQGGVNPLPKFPAGSSGGTFTASPAGIVFLNTSTGEINLSKSTPGTYTITNTIAASGGCTASSATTDVTIYPEVAISAGPAQTVAAGAPVQLAGSISGGATSGTWSGGSGSFSNTGDPHATYIPGAGETSATLILTSADPVSPCGARSSNVIITFASQPAAPTVSGKTICAGNTAGLSATAPGGFYEWFDVPTAGTHIATGANYTTIPLTADATYYVQTTINGLTSNRTAVQVTVTQIPTAPVVTGNQACYGSPAILTASGSSGNYEWYAVPVGGNLLSNQATYTTNALTANATYYVQGVSNGCTSTRTQVDITVNPAPNVTSSSSGSICSGNALNYLITADIPATTFTWSRDAVTGISNPAVTNQTASTITETLVNTTGSAINVTYVITPVAGSCAGAPFNYVVTVNPQPVVTSAPTETICNQNAVNYAVTFNTPSSFSWSRAAVAGISNAAVSGQAASTIREVLYNTTTAPVDVVYTYTYATGTCQGLQFNLTVTVNPTVSITSATSGNECSGTQQGYTITSNIPSATFNWSRGATAGISNAAVSNQTSSTIDETLINTTKNPIGVAYIITPTAFGCDGAAFRYNVTVNPSVDQPVANVNSPICVGQNINLRTLKVANATYLWTGPNGYTSNLASPDIINVTLANAGTYTLVETVRGCDSPPATVTMDVQLPPGVDAGPENQTVCINVPSVQLNGKVTGGTTTGIWTTSGSGTFTPAIDALNGQYMFSDADKAAGSVILTLTSTGKAPCPSIASTTITFGAVPGVDAGADQEVCSQVGSVKLTGQLLANAGTTQWTTSGSGSFSPSDSQLDASYVPSAADIQSGLVNLTLNLNGGGECYTSTNNMTIKFIPPPTVNAGGTRYVLKGHTIVLEPTVSDNNVTYQWSPNVNISEVTAKNPTITGDVDQTYTLTVTDSRGCVSSDQTFVKVSPQINVNNTFTPNGDGINDLWEITGLIAYENATVDIFNRYGQLLFHSIGYPKAWDGTYGGSPVPSGVYYYIIKTNVNNLVLSGYVTIVR